MQFNDVTMRNAFYVLFICQQKLYLDTTFSDKFLRIGCLLMQEIGPGLGGRVWRNERSLLEFCGCPEPIDTFIKVAKCCCIGIIFLLSSFPLFLYQKWVIQSFLLYPHFNCSSFVRTFFTIKLHRHCWLFIHTFCDFFYN